MSGFSFDHDVSGEIEEARELDYLRECRMCDFAQGIAPSFAEPLAEEDEE